MARELNKDTVYRAAKSRDKDYTINDGGGLHLLIKTNGSKLWQFVYTLEGKRNKLALGIYPNTTLDKSRREAEQARDNIANGIDPSEIKREARKAKQLAKRGVAIFAKACFGHPSPSKRQKSRDR